MSDFKFTRPDNFPPIVKNLIIINAIVFLAQWIFKSQQGVDLVMYGGLFEWNLEYFRP